MGNAADVREAALMANQATIAAKAPKRFTGAAPNEDQIQRGVVQFLRYSLRAGVAWFHVPNGGQRGRVEGARFVGLGVKAGVPDFLLVADGRLFCLELKTAHGRLSPSQVVMQSELRAAGAAVETVHSLETAMDQIARWCPTRRQAFAPMPQQKGLSHG
jgi:hypothetical protein